MLKIQRFVNGEFVIPALSGRIEAENLEHLQALLRAERQRIVLDLNEVNLVSRDGGNSWRVPSRMAFGAKAVRLTFASGLPESEEESDSSFLKVSRDSM